MEATGRSPGVAASAGSLDESDGSCVAEKAPAGATSSQSPSREPRRSSSSKPVSEKTPVLESPEWAWDGAAVLHLELRHLRVDYAGIRASDPAAEAKLLASIAREGQKVPILVARGGPHEHQVLDGFRRRLALMQLGQDIILAVEWPGGAVDGLIQVRQPRTGSASGPLEEGWLIEALVELHDLSLDEVGERLGRTKSWVHRRLSLVHQLPEVVRLKVFSGTLTGYIATKYAVPLARANGDLVGPYCDCVIAHGLSTRQAGTVYQYLMHTPDPAVQKEILDRPERVLEPGATRKHSKETVGGLESLDRLERWCRHTSVLRGMLTHLLADGVSDDLLERILVLWRGHRETARTVLKQLDDLAGPSSGCDPLARANESPDACRRSR
jgi:hypothetical protein